jgi:hypothetical protein
VAAAGEGGEQLPQRGVLPAHDRADVGCDALQ